MWVPYTNWNETVPNFFPQKQQKLTTLKYVKTNVRLCLRILNWYGERWYRSGCRYMCDSTMCDSPRLPKGLLLLVLSLNEKSTPIQSEIVYGKGYFKTDSGKDDKSRDMYDDTYDIWYMIYMYDATKRNQRTSAHDFIFPRKIVRNLEWRNIEWRFAMLPHCYHNAVTMLTFYHNVTTMLTTFWTRKEWRCGFAKDVWRNFQGLLPRDFCSRCWQVAPRTATGFRRIRGSGFDSDPGFRFGEKNIPMPFGKILILKRNRLVILQSVFW